MLIKSPPKKKGYTVLELDNFSILDAEDILQQTVSNRVIAKISKIQILRYERGNVF